MDSARFFLLGILIALYMLAGAAIFSFLERPFELQAHRLWTSRLKTFSEEHNISHAEIKSILYHYEEARTAGIRAQQGRALWDFPGAFYFVGTVVSTIGFGVSAPSTVTGKILLVFYGLLGCSATILFFNLFLERVITFLSVSLMWCCRGKSHHSSLQDRNHEDDENNWKPSILQVTLVLLVAVLLVACCAALVYSVMEGWSYMESLYFCFVAFSTVGFGDFVSGQREQHEETRGYQVANCLLMLLGIGRIQAPSSPHNTHQCPMILPPGATEISSSSAAIRCHYTRYLSHFTNSKTNTPEYRVYISNTTSVLLHRTAKDSSWSLKSQQDNGEYRGLYQRSRE
uniref:Potassium channel domain-containing protein n=1 Tax=Periophthalmus magnuspinnatus TaxID=409849 RepID=A0A3B4A813_9GOBI